MYGVLSGSGDMQAYQPKSAEPGPTAKQLAQLKAEHKAFVMEYDYLANTMLRQTELAAELVAKFLLSRPPAIQKKLLADAKIKKALEMAKQAAKAAAELKHATMFLKALG